VASVICLTRQRYVHTRDTRLFSPAQWGDILLIFSLCVAPRSHVRLLTHTPSSHTQVNLLGYLSACAGADFSLDDTQKANLTAIVLIGELLGSILWAYLADIYGRRLSCIVAFGCVAVFSWFSGKSNLKTLKP